MSYRSELQGVVRKSLASKAYETIREMILTEQIKEGDLIPETTLAKSMNMSRTPVREAIRKLENEGILYSIDGIGTFLSKVSLKDIIDMYEVRAALEVIALRTSIRYIKSEELSEIRRGMTEVLELMNGGADEQKCVEKMAPLDAKLHDLIVSKSDNNYVKRVIEEIYFKIERNRRLAYGTHMTTADSARQHIGIIDAILEGDLPRASELLSKHIEWSLGTLEAYMLRR